MTDGLTVLGSCGAWPEAGRACSGFLLRHRGACLVLDLGWGTYPRLAAALNGDTTLAGVVVTHEHPDHMADLGALLRRRWFAERDAAPLPVLGTPGVLRRLRASDPDAAEVAAVVLAWQHVPSEPVDLGPFRITTVAVPHFVPAVAVRVGTPAWSVAYTGDSGPCAELDDLARGVDLLLAEASDREQQTGTPPGPTGRQLHLDADDAGRLAATSGARRLVLTHAWPGNDREQSRARAARHTDVAVALADEGVTFALP